MLGPVLAGSGVHDIMMNLHLNVVTTFMTGVCEVNASLCDTVVHGPFLRFRHGDFTRSIAAAILLGNAVKHFVSQYKKCTYKISIVE